MPDVKSQLAEYLDHVVERVDADEILGGPIVGELRAPSSGRPANWVPGWAYAVVTAAVVLLLIGVTGYLAGQRVDRGAFPPQGLVGLLDLPPEGARPNTPLVGELVVSMWSHVEADGWFATGSIYIYEDGRLIWNSFLPGDPANTTGWVEQLLTPEAVALVRDEIIATGLFDPADPVGPRGLPAFGHIQVRVGDQLVSRGKQSGTNDEFDGIHHRLRNLHARLPANAWEDPKPTMYVPSTYGVCLESGSAYVPADPSEQLVALPEPAQELLSAATYYRPGELGDKDPVVGATWYSPHC